MHVKLSAAEAYLWHFIQTHQQQVIHLSIVKLSELANVSTATVVRTMKKQGYSGYTAFRQKLILAQQDTAKYDVLTHASKEIRSVILKNETEVSKTLQQLDFGTIEDSVQKLHDAKKIYIFARGLSELIAREMLIKFQLLGKNTEMHDDPNIIRTISKRIRSDEVVILITLNGQTAEIVTAAQNLAANDITIITFTTDQQAPVVAYSDLVFLGYKSGLSYFPEYEVRSRLPLQVMTRILTDAYAVRIKQ